MMFAIRRVYLVAMLGASALPMLAQQPMGSVSTRDAQVNGGLRVQGDRASLVSNASVTAFDHTATIDLARGGQVLVCSTSAFHLLHSGDTQALLFGLDRGALELHTKSEPRDVILTPDIRFTIEHPGEFDLGLRVTRNGDTCVDNKGNTAPVLVLNDSFGGASYRLMPGQHVLFERGSLREVVDNERSPCGCPQPSQMTAGDRAAKQNPFPEAASEGLAPVTPAENDTQPGQKHTQVSTTFTYGEGQGPPPSTVDPSAHPGSAQDQPGATHADTAPARPHGFFHAIGNFFHRLFHPGSTPSS
jgi:hypothetical protein